MGQKNTVVISHDLNEKVKQAAAREGLKKSQWVERELTKVLETQTSE